MTALRKSLFDINEEYLQLMDLIEEQEGIISLEMDQLLKINEKEKEEKLKGYFHVIKLLESDNIAIDNEITRLSKKKTAKENIIKRLKEKMLEAVEAWGTANPKSKTGSKQMKFDTLNLWTVDTKSVEIEFEDDFEVDEFTTYQVLLRFKKAELEKIKKALGMTDEVKLATSKHISKEGIKKALEEDKVVPGAEFKYGSYIRMQ